MIRASILLLCALCIYGFGCTRVSNAVSLKNATAGAVHLQKYFILCDTDTIAKEELDMILPQRHDTLFFLGRSVPMQWDECMTGAWLVYQQSEQRYMQFIPRNAFTRYRHRPVRLRLRNAQQLTSSDALSPSP